MTIAIFSDTYMPVKNGVSTSINQLKEGMEQLGHKVIIVTISLPDYQEVDENIIRVWTMPAGVSDEDRFAGIVNKSKLLKILKPHNIDLVHVHTEFSLGFAGRKIAKLLNVPLVATTHTMWEEYRHYVGPWMTRGMARSFMRFSLKKAYAVVCPSIKAQKYLADLMPEKYTRVVPNGIDMHKFMSTTVTDEMLATTRKTYDINEDKKVLLFVGRIGREKRVEALYETLKDVLTNREDTILLYVGAGPDYEALRDKIAKDGMRDYVKFTGFVDWKEVYKLYNVADILLSASLSEVHPMTAIEGAICGLPSIVRRDDSFVDLVHSGVNGYLVDSDEEIAQKVKELIDDDVKLAEFSKESKRISQDFSAQKHVEKMLAYYEDIVKTFPNKLTV